MSQFNVIYIKIFFIFKANNPLRHIHLIDLITCNVIISNRYYEINIYLKIQIPFQMTVFLFKNNFFFQRNLTYFKEK